MILFFCQANVYFITYIYIYKITFDATFFFSLYNSMRLRSYEKIKQSEIKNYAFEQYNKKITKNINQ